MDKRLQRSRRDRVLAGACGGLGDYVNVDPVIVRVIFVLLALADGFGVILYIVLWIVVPQQGRAGAPTGDVVRENIEGIGEDLRRMGDEVKEALRRTEGPPREPPSPSVDVSIGGPQEPPHHVPKEERTIPLLVGVALVVLGVVWLIDNLDLEFLPFLSVWQLWPLGLIVAGLLLLLPRRR